MKQRELGEILRQRQYAKGIVPADIIASLTDELIIDSYITCSCCGKKQVNDTKILNQIIAQSDTVDEFFDSCDAAASFADMHNQHGVH
jgi:hypothetical protein